MRRLTVTIVFISLGVKGTSGAAALHAARVCSCFIVPRSGSRKHNFVILGETSALVQRNVSWELRLASFSLRTRPSKHGREASSLPSSSDTFAESCLMPGSRPGPDGPQQRKVQQDSGCVDRRLAMLESV